MYLLDTDVIVEYLRGDKKVIDKIKELSEKGLSATTISISELYYGIYKSSKVDENTKKVIDFFSGVTILNVNLAVCKLFGKIKADLKSRGKLAGDFDILIASITIANNLILVTGNEKHFKDIKSLKLMGL